ncbi:MAG: phosphate ABC transporter substrate-binding protein PstS, partial [Chitinophagaceae bacterium]
ATQSDSTSSSSASDMTLLGAGSTFIYPLFSKQFEEYNKLTGLKVNYQSIGSGGGILQLMNKTVDFGDSDAPLNDDQTKKMGAPILHVPMACGADVLSFNLPGVQDTLDFTPTVLADVFLGKITKWNDPAISKINPGVKFPDMQIVVAHRSDGSGTTYIWADYLSKVSPEWAAKVGKSTSVNWPVGLGGKGNEGVAGLIKETPGCLGYIELAYAFQNKMQIAKIQNKSGNFIAPSFSSITAAGNIQLPPDSKVSITNTDSPDGYPISSFTWAILYKEQNYNNRSQARALNMIKLLWWNTHEGQKYCQPLIYAPLAPAAVKVAENILKSATYNGTPLLQN